MSTSEHQYISDSLVGGGNTGDGFANGGEWADAIAKIAVDNNWFETDEDAGDGWGCYTESTNGEEYKVSRRDMIEYWQEYWGQ